jgi:steroid delta-isomerase-like uncharacterized protein
MSLSADAIIHAYYAAFNAGDAQAFLDLLAEDVVHDINQSGREIGKPAFAVFLQAMSKSYQETIADLIVFTAADGTRAAAEFTVHGKYLQASHGMPPAHGQEYTLPAGAFFTIRDSKIARISNYYNLPAWMAQVS